MLKNAINSPAKKGGRRKRMSLGVVLFVCLISVQIVTTLVVFGSSYVNSERAIRRQSLELLVSRSRTLINDLTMLMHMAENSTKLMARFLENGAIDPSDELAVERTLFELLQASPRLSRASLAVPNGGYVVMARSEDSEAFVSWICAEDKTSIVVTYRDSRFLPQGRTVRQPLISDPVPISRQGSDPREPRKLHWGQTVEIAKDRVTGIAVRVSAFKDDALVGVVGMEIALPQVGVTLRDSSARQNQTVTMLTQDGETIIQADGMTYREGTAIKARNDTIVGAAVEQFDATGRPVFLNMDVKEQGVGTKSHLVYLARLPILDLGWLIAVHVDQDDLTAGLQDGQRRLWWIAALGLLLLSPLSIILANRVRNPLVVFSNKTEEVADGGEIDVSGIDPPYAELESTGRALTEEMSQRRNFQSAYEQTFDASSRGMARMEPQELEFAQVNDRLTQMFGMSREELQQTSLWKLLGKEYHDTLKEFLSSLVADKEFSFDFQFRGKESDETWFRASALLIRDHSGASNHALVIFDNIDEARRNRNMLKEFKRDLHHVGRVNVMGQFAAGLAHELNQPLGAILHDIDSMQLLMARPENSDEEVMEILNDIGRHAERSGDIIRALRDLIQKDRSGAKSFPFMDLLDQTRTIMEPEAKLYGVQYNIHVKPDLHVVGNRSQIAQVLVNLIRNAFEASARDPMNVCEVTIRAELQEESVFIRIEDNGPGVPAKVQPFVQFNSTRPGGMGLGLSICKSLVVANDGQIRYEPIDPRGSRFVIELPSDHAPDQEAN